MNPKVDKYISKAQQWQEEIEQLRIICLDCGLKEELKWGKPCYSFQESNIAIIQPFKVSCALMFFKGVLLKDPEDVLEKPGEHSRIARRISFTSIQKIVEMEPILKAYIDEAIEAEKAGLEVDIEEKREPIPEEFQKKLDENPGLKTAFSNLTPGRQRGYILYFSGAKQSKTRERRIEKYIPKILDGKGLRE
ncbi:YdeI/OmpD-associated family protein [Aliifodinibius salicampi]|uniref:YdeI/OmpD-associated family protein n=1 Tax=Fodinibius salicampi TaxID=1920655 RepID=A0ABT3PZU1_9BACT|nr:YdeI/OmpD-associated family protein [Fodinibius salicampi]MCW9713345.1 YdeI/OmpD-associated family protein [Fodinibius salicampi]